ncbi:hypothetical protein V6767_22305 [Martelella sp. FLE1502]
MTAHQRQPASLRSKQRGTAKPVGDLRREAGTLLRKRRAQLLTQAAIASVIAGFIGMSPAAAAPVPTCPDNPLNATGVTFGGNCDLGATGFVVAVSGDGSLTINGGGKLASYTGSIGSAAGYIGAVTVSGAGSNWTLGSALTIGDSGNGTLTIEGGGTVNSGTAYLGYAAGSQGSVTVTGSSGTDPVTPSHWKITNQLDVGWQGQGILSILDGGEVEVVGMTRIGGNDSAEATVSGSGSKLMAGGLYIGGSQATATLDVLGGGSVLVAESGELASYRGAYMLVSGAGSRAKFSELVIGRDYYGGVVTVSKGGVINADTVLLGGIGEGFGDIGWLYIGGGQEIDGELQQPAAPGTVDTESVTFAGERARLVFNHTSDDFTFSADLIDDSTFNIFNPEIENYAGTTILTGDGSSFAGTISVWGGRLEHRAISLQRMLLI